MSSLSNYRFFLTLLCEFISSPFLYLYNCRKAKGSKRPVKYRKRIPVDDDKIEVFIHEWGGYSLSRVKKVNKLHPFECGIIHQLVRFQKEKGSSDLNINVTVSDIERYDSHDLKIIESMSDNVIPVSNRGMDFSGYAEAQRILSKSSNRYVVLTNSSINKIQGRFLSGYINLLASDLTIGAIGISFNTKYNCTLIKNNFNPHIQSFFILTTTSVLNEIVHFNRGRFPGMGITSKYMLIRNGEVKFSQLLLKQNYKLLAVLEDGSVFTFDKHTPLQEFPYDDYRISCKNPNTISPIKQNQPI